MRLCHVHILVAGIDRCLRVSWLRSIDRVRIDRIQLVLLDDGAARDAHLAGLPVGAPVAVEKDAVGDERHTEEEPLKGAERGGGLGGVRGAVVVVGAGLELRAGPAVAGGREAVGPVPGGSDEGEQGEGHQPPEDGEALEDEVGVFVVGHGVPEGGDFDVADEDESPDEGEDGHAVAGIKDQVTAACVGGQCHDDEAEKL